VSIRGIFLCLFLGAAASASAQSQPQQPSALKAAQTGLIDALSRQDRAAFEKYLAADAFFTIPFATHGADAIVQLWLPLLTPGRGSVTMTAGDPVTAGSGDLAYTTGTLALKTQVSNVAQNGEYVAVWRLIDGNWKLAVLSGGNASAGRLGGVGGYRFGMMLDDVRMVSDCMPYTNVSQTGGLECANYTFEGRKMNISFLFNGGRLRRIQLWLYEGTSEANAKEALARAIDYLRRTAGGVSMAVAPGEVTPDRVMEVLNQMPLQANGAAQFDLSTPAGPQPEVWFGRVVRRQPGYVFVFLFADQRAQ
jgi:ketosteroid isomerase-like protein